MNLPPPDLVTDELEGETCAWADDDGECQQPAVTTRYSIVDRAWVPVCDEHRR